MDVVELVVGVLPMCERCVRSLRGDSPGGGDNGKRLASPIAGVEQSLRGMYRIREGEGRLANGWCLSFSFWALNVKAGDEGAPLLI